MADRVMEDRFRDWALQQDDLRAGLVVGSRARDDHPPDRWSDLDVVLFVRDVERRWRDASWLGEIAPPWLSLRGHTAGGEPEYLALFEGGEQVDVVLHPVTDLAALAGLVDADDVPDTIRRGARILFDKDGLLALLPRPSRPRPRLRRRRPSYGKRWRRSGSEPCTAPSSCGGASCGRSRTAAR